MTALFKPKEYVAIYTLAYSLCTQVRVACLAWSWFSWGWGWGWVVSRRHIDFLSHVSIHPYMHTARAPQPQRQALRQAQRGG